ncbi:hypothetical protein cyc_02891 [Cyclospora cayetanensis]|uniref:Uncharacterized protein n=1 Tax=Cyclospora cayetanensis TaxID=88456 RepID=A0A1D3D1P0_9EIME|nr:hypothetical protein cyc_02891 [Cyclospora cayetanensis]
MARGIQQRRVASDLRAPLESQPQATNKNKEVVLSGPPDGFGALEEASEDVRRLCSSEGVAISDPRGRERGPWGGGKVWLDMDRPRSVNSSASSRCRLLATSRSWATKRMLRACVRTEFFRSSYRFRGHEGCVNAIKFHPTEPWLFSGGDDLRLLIWEPRVWPRIPKAAMRTEHTDNIFCIDFDKGTGACTVEEEKGEVGAELVVIAAAAAAALGSHALTAANDGLVTRLPLGASPSAASETRDFYSIYGRLHGPMVEEMSSLSLPLTHPDATPPLPPPPALEGPDGGVAVVNTASEATAAGAAAANGGSGSRAAGVAARNVAMAILEAADDELIFFPRARTRACFEAKFVDTAGQIAAAALEAGFVALADFRERPEISHPVMRNTGDFTSVDPHLPLPFQLAYAGSCGAGILDLRTARPLLRLRAPGVLDSDLKEEDEKPRGSGVEGREGRDIFGGFGRLLLQTLLLKAGQPQQPLQETQLWRDDAPDRGASGAPAETAPAETPAAETPAAETPAAAMPGAITLSALFGDGKSGLKSGSDGDSTVRVPSDGASVKTVKSAKLSEQAGSHEERQARRQSHSRECSALSSPESPARSSAAAAEELVPPQRSKCSSSSSKADQDEADDVSSRAAATPPSARGKRRCIRPATAQQEANVELSNRSSSSSSASGLPTGQPSSVMPRTRLQHAASAAALSSDVWQPQRRRCREAQQAELETQPPEAIRASRSPQQPVQRPQRVAQRAAAREAAAAIRRLSERLRHHASTPASNTAQTGAPAEEGEGGRPSPEASQPSRAAVATPSESSARGAATEGMEELRESSGTRRGRRSQGAARRGPCLARSEEGVGTTSSGGRGPLIRAGAQEPRQRSPSSAAQPVGARQRGRRERHREEPLGDAAQGLESFGAGSSGPLGAAERPASDRIGAAEGGSLQEGPPGVREALMQAEAIAAQLPAIRFPTYRTVSRQIGASRHRHRARTLADVPCVEMVDKIVFSWDGKLLLALPLFELQSDGYTNFTTMKGGCFLTDGRHVACGSEDLQVHMWRLPSPLPQRPSATQALQRVVCLPGHLCVVNCCASPSPQSPLGLWGPPMLATSGVEKMVRVWSCEVPRDVDDCDHYPIDGRFITHETTEDFVTIARFNRATPIADRQDI